MMYGIRWGGGMLEDWLQEDSMMKKNNGERIKICRKPYVHMDLRGPTGPSVTNRLKNIIGMTTSTFPVISRKKRRIDVANHQQNMCRRHWEDTYCDCYRGSLSQRKGGRIFSCFGAHRTTYQSMA